MKNSYLIEDRGDYIEVHSQGVKDRDFGLRLWTDIIEACTVSGCFRVLGIANTSNPPEPWQAFDLAGLMQEVGLSMKYRLAWVEQNPDAVEGVKFFETVLNNRGLAIARLFPDVDQASEWLLAESG